MNMKYRRKKCACEDIIGQMYCSYTSRVTSAM